MNYFDEMFGVDGVRQHYSELSPYLANSELKKLIEKDLYSKKLLSEYLSNSKSYIGLEFDKNPYPFDVIPRILTIDEWNMIAAGISQRLLALNLFLVDIYGKQEIINDNIIPLEIINSCPYYIKEMSGIRLPNKIHIHISGFDLVRGERGDYFILEDNLRIPSGIYAALESRAVSDLIFTELREKIGIQSQIDYTRVLLGNLFTLTNQQKSKPNIIILTLGVISYSYIEQCYLAKNMGIPLVEPKDLIVENNFVFMKTRDGLQKIDIIYRRMDDEYFIPSIGKIEKNRLFGDINTAYLKGNVVLVNAIGNGVADDKAIYSYVPDIIKYYLNENPIIKNVETYRMDIQEERDFVYNDIGHFVIKKTDSMRGIGMLMGNTSSEETIEKFKLDIADNPRNFIAQPIINFSKLPCLIDGKLSARRIDLRPYALLSENGVKVINAVLTRVAIKDDSYDVSSPQGCRKDTWILNT